MGAKLHDGQRGDGSSRVAQALLAQSGVLGYSTHQKGDLLLPALRYRVGPGCCQMLTSAMNHSQHFLDEQDHIFKMRKIPIPWFQEGE